MSAETDIKKIVKGIPFVDLDFAKETAGSRIKQAMQATGYPQKYFTEEGSEFHRAIASQMDKKGGYSQAQIKKYLKGDFGVDKERKQFTSFMQGVAAYFNLSADMNCFFDDIDDANFKRLAKQRWKEKYKVQMQLFTRTTPPGKGFKEKLSQSKRISFSSISLYNTICKYKQAIETALKQGGELRMIIINPEGPGIKECSFRSSQKWAELTYSQEIGYTLEEVSQWVNKFKYYKINIRLIDFLPSYALTIIEPKADDAKVHCHARLFPFRSTSLKGPAINPDPVQHKEWCDYFIDQYEELWKAAARLEMKTRRV